MADDKLAKREQMQNLITFKSSRTIYACTAAAQPHTFDFYQQGNVELQACLTNTNSEGDRFHEIAQTHLASLVFRKAPHIAASRLDLIRGILHVLLQLLI